MMTREKAKEMAMEVIATREKEKADKAKVFVNDEVGKVIEDYAKCGKFECTIFIPSHLDKTQVIELIKEKGYEVHGEYAYAEFKIIWE